MIRKSIVLVGALLTLSSAAFAQNSGSTVTTNAGPERGMTKSAVERSFGSPQTKRSAIGDPPISRWVYDGFTVYFEFDRVIHAVNNR